MKPVDYKQTDPKWGKRPYAAPGEDSTIASAGCGPTCMAMVIATLADKRVQPDDTANWALAHKYKALKQGTYYTYFTPQGAAYGVVVEQLNKANLKNVANKKQYHDAALKAVINGDMVICCMGPGHWTKGGHYILWHGVEGINALINDPATNAPNRAKALIATLQAEVKYYWIARVPDEKKDPVSEEVISVVAKNTRKFGYLKGGHSYVPVRSVAEAFGAKVGWDPIKEKATVNDYPIEMENRSGVAHSQARLLAAILGVQVDWDANSKTVTFKKG